MGKGYQAKHVVRQAVASSSNDAVIDMTRAAVKVEKAIKGSKKSKKSKKRSKLENDQVADEEARKHPRPDPRLGAYLSNRGMRDFVRDVDKILRSQQR